MSTTRRLTLAANQGDIGGGEVMLLHLARAVREIGVPVHVVAPGGSPIAHAARDQGFDVTGLGTSRRDYLQRLARWSPGPGLLWCNGLAPAFVTAGRGGRVVHLHQVPKGKHARAARAARLRAVATLVPSRSTAADVAGARVLENWTAEVTPSRERPRGRTVGFLGRPSVDKGVLVLAESLRLLTGRSSDTRRSNDPLRLLLAGEPRFVAADDHRAVTDSLRRLDGLVEQPGWMAPPDFFSRVDLLVVPSLAAEAFGLVVAEAMSARVPFVVSDAGALPEVAGPDHPWVVPAGDAAALADTVEAALAAPDAERESAVSAARDRWEARFSPDAGRDRLAALLTELGVL